MAKYEKWLGASLGWIMTGNPLGGLLGYLAGSMTEDKSASANRTLADVEINLIVLASHLIKIDGKISPKEVAFTKHFLDSHFDEKFSVKRSEVLDHCLQKEYSLNTACEQLRMYTKHATRVQIIQFLLDIAISDGELTERENYFIFKLAGYLNINDIDYKRIKAGLSSVPYVETGSWYEVIGISRQADIGEIRTAYRKLVLKYHPDRNIHLTETEKKTLALKLQRVKEAYERIKEERGEK